MPGVLEGFATIAIVIGVGTLLAHTGLLDAHAQRTLSKLAFYVASPALLFSVLFEAHPAEVFSAPLLTQVCAVAVTATIAVLGERLVWRRDLAGTTMGTLSASYANAMNIGLPLTVYVLGEGTAVVPLLLFQLLLYQPLGLALMDRATAPRRLSLGQGLLVPLRNPLIAASALGVALSAFDVRLPNVVAGPIDLLAGMAVPAMLLAYGISLRLGPRPGAAGALAETAFLATLKLVVQPLVAYVAARWVFALTGPDLLAAVVVAALPTAQNVFVFAVRYDRSVPLVRDVVLATTVLCVPVVVGAAALLG